MGNAIIGLMQLTERKIAFIIWLKFYKSFKVQKLFPSKSKWSCSDPSGFIIWCITATFPDQFSALACDKAALNLSFPTSNTLHKLKSIQI